ncbi:ecto-ADP-ribosyltransferase 4-like isoform X4 [Thunnus thynnus]|uniref:ecto-ADP-ribosyltransferase 4-like isoform X4 n=1 Tax=Thunnus thynnus TaxID=8237 RepID=UPI003529459D
MAVPCTIIMAATVLTALMPPIYCLNSSSFPLDIGCEAVDDKYDGCDKEMKDKVEKKYFKKENKKIFKDVWTKCSKKEYSEDEALTKNHMQAICAYTSNSGKKANDKKLYDEFNKAVRTGRKLYDSSFKFKFHFLHYWLTTAIQILNRNQKKQDCQITYRKTDVEFTGKVNDIIRFGAFASSSKEKDLGDFGNKTCFEIETCSGAYLGNYSEVPDEEEVLIPPYETFKITDIFEGRGKYKDLKDCEKVFVLKSVGEVSNLNCKLAPK